MFSQPGNFTHALRPYQFAALLGSVSLGVLVVHTPGLLCAYEAHGMSIRNQHDSRASRIDGVYRGMKGTCPIPTDIRLGVRVSQWRI